MVLDSCGNGGPGFDSDFDGGNGGFFTVKPANLSGTLTRIEVLCTDSGNGGNGFDGCPLRGSSGGDAVSLIEIWDPNFTSVNSFSGGNGGAGSLPGTGGKGTEEIITGPGPNESFNFSRSGPRL